MLWFIWPKNLKIKQFFKMWRNLLSALPCACFVSTTRQTPRSTFLKGFLTLWKEISVSSTPLALLSIFLATFFIVVTMGALFAVHRLYTKQTRRKMLSTRKKNSCSGIVSKNKHVSSLSLRWGFRNGKKNGPILPMKQRFKIGDSNIGVVHPFSNIQADRTQILFMRLITTIAPTFRPRYYWDGATCQA